MSPSEFLYGVAFAMCIVGLAGWRGRRPLFYVLAVVGQLVWFVDYLAFLYGIHAYPLA